MLGNRDAGTLSTMSSFGALLQGEGRLDEAVPLLREVLQTRREMLGDRHPDTVASMNNLAMLLKERGDHDEAEIAEGLYIEALRARYEY